MRFSSFAGVSIEADINSLVTILTAIDADTLTSDNVTYDIRDVSSRNAKDSGATVRASNSSFVIGQHNGSVYTNTLMDRYRSHFFNVTVQAEDIDARASETTLLARDVLMTTCISAKKFACLINVLLRLARR